jgi:hypothetical protein
MARHAPYPVLFAKLGVAFGTKLRYIARCCSIVEKISFFRRKERREKNTNQSTLEGEIFAGKNARLMQKASGSAPIGAYKTS